MTGMCRHDGVLLEWPEYGSPHVVDAHPTAAFPFAFLADDNSAVDIEGNRITLCGEVVYEVTDWHHQCAGMAEEFAFAHKVEDRRPVRTWVYRAAGEFGA